MWVDHGSVETFDPMMLETLEDEIVGGGLLSLQPAVQSAARDEPFTWQCVSGQCGDAKCGKCSAAAAE